MVQRFLMITNQFQFVRYRDYLVVSGSSFQKINTNQSPVSPDLIWDLKRMQELQTLKIRKRKRCIDNAMCLILENMSIHPMALYLG